jgi:hypothetical protein
MFLDTLSRYLAVKYARFGEGEIWFSKQRVAFNFLPILAREFLINNEANRETYSAAVFLSARRTGYEYVRQHGIPMMKNWTAVVSLGMEWLNQFGDGTLRTVRADNKEGFGIVSGRLAFGQEVKAESPNNTEPVDFVIGGLVAGTIQYYTKTKIYAVETSCIAQKGVQECLLVTGSRDSILGYVKKFSPDKAELASVTLNRIQALEKEVEESEDQRWLI